MILGRRYARLKRNINAEEIRVEFRDKQGLKLKNLPRKLNMLFVLHILKDGKVNKKALLREFDKYDRIVNPKRNGRC